MSERYKARKTSRLILTMGVVACCTSCGSLNEGQRVAPFVPQRGVQSSADTFAGPPEVQEYDREFTSSVCDRWYDLLDSRDYAFNDSGKVIVAFKLHSDGRIRDMEVVEQTVDAGLALLCEKAILDLSPFAKWPDAMRETVKEGFRRIVFTFYYNVPPPEKQRKR